MRTIFMLSSDRRPHWLQCYDDSSKSLITDGHALGPQAADVRRRGTYESSARRRTPRAAHAPPARAMHHRRFYGGRQHAGRLRVPNSPAKFRLYPFVQALILL